MKCPLALHVGGVYEFWSDAGSDGAEIRCISRAQCDEINNE